LIASIERCNKMSSCILATRHRLDRKLSADTLNVRPIGTPSRRAFAASMSTAALDAWGWRIPFLLGLVVGIAGLASSFSDCVRCLSAVIRRERRGTDTPQIQGHQSGNQSVCAQWCFRSHQAAPGNGEPEYRIKSANEPHERVARESELIKA
jgi:hypothetical protein